MFVVVLHGDEGHCHQVDDQNDGDVDERIPCRLSMRLDDVLLLVMVGERLVVRITARNFRRRSRRCAQLLNLLLQLLRGPRDRG